MLIPHAFNTPSGRHVHTRKVKYDKSVINVCVCASARLLPLQAGRTQVTGVTSTLDYWTIFVRRPRLFAQPTNQASRPQRSAVITNESFEGKKKRKKKKSESKTRP